MPLDTTSFLTVNAESAVNEIKIKGSRFIGQVFHIESIKEFDFYYQQLKKKYIKAAHYCYAYRITHDRYHYYDDGEPSGSAGKPIYGVLSGKNLFQILLIVVRYFGGIKLGRNGLVRAYRQSAQETLQQARLVTRIFYTIFSIQLPYEHVHNLQHLVKKYDGTINKTDYLDQVKVYAQIPASRYSDFKNELNTLAPQGRIIQVSVENSSL
jgi:uncharacterized YigZ family protein